MKMQFGRRKGGLKTREEQLTIWQ